jgi:hypothetical protein
MLATVVLVLLSFGLGAQDETVSIGNLTTAKAFLHAAYPLLPTSSMVHVLGSSELTGLLWFRRFRVYVTEAGKEIDPSQVRNVLLATDFAFDETGRIEKYFASGTLVRDNDNRELSKEVGRHPEWSDLRIAAELKARGAQFGPSQGEALISTLVIRNFEPMLGELTLLESTFRIPSESERKRGESFGEGSINWRLDFQSGTGVFVVIDVEPFGGAVTAVHTMRRRIAMAHAVNIAPIESAVRPTYASRRRTRSASASGTATQLRL